MLDRTGWGAGPWDAEPDRAEWRDEATGLPCLAHRNLMGAWCGYVAVPPGHRLHGKGYDDDDVEGVDVHGGLTYAAACTDHICHVPAPGEPDDVWWFGFDCAHFQDYVPGLFPTQPMHLKRHLQRDQTYRDLAYVREECTSLAATLSRL